MEATVVSLGKAVLDGALGYARSKAAEEVALQLGIEDDVTFIVDELEMMQSFLMSADEERGQHKVLATWVKQVRDLAYNAEDSLMDFSLLSEKKRSWWCSPRTAGERRRIAMEMKKLRTMVEDVSNRNLRYRLIKESCGSKPSAAEEQASVATAAMFGINEARLADLEKEKSEMDLHQLITSEEEELRVIAVWGTSGDLGKTSAIQQVYDEPNVFRNFGFHAWVRLSHPFNPKEFIYSIRCLIVLDDISSTAEWDLVENCLKNARRVIVTTREKNIAKHCSSEYKNMYSLEGLKDDDALELFKRKSYAICGTAAGPRPMHCPRQPPFLEPCATETCHPSHAHACGFLASRPKTVVEWRKMNDHISSELEINPELRTIESVLMRSYNGLPYQLKSAFLYLSIFPEDHKIRWDRLVRRWIAKGYSRDMHGMTAEELGRKYFDELLDRSMILPGEDVNHYNGQINSCQLHDIIREICISKAREENLVLTLEEGFCLSSTQGAIRHLVIGSNWKRDKDVLESLLDLSHVRFLRVLDLENTVGLRDHHLDQIGQLRHLMYFSLRGCMNIYCLPDSLGNLRHLQTLDVRAETGVFWDDRVYGVKVHVGIGKLKALQTLGVVNIARGNGKALLKELGGLTQLMQGGSYEDVLDGSLGEGLWPPSCLESLKLCGKLVRVTSWIHQLQNLSKLTLEFSSLKQDDAIQALGALPNLAVLRLKQWSFNGKQLHFQGPSFPSLAVLEFYGLFNLESVLFEEEAMPRLELLQVDWCRELKEISGLAVLTNLREIRLGDYVTDELREEVKSQVAEHLKHVRLNLS
ncbi:hypothetical protein BRADI_2g38791v3 [Brachypodium distachyon]|uniref:Rx N-terminal domain-containing protein n=1 Tax=Brachypodium distachyon TaxID=15368 RepID=A0A2K2DCP0_BRADI|nr:hypothetical protein BRADI_2g38791v3 [Brachypodium distachyon]